MPSSPQFQFAGFKDYTRLDHGGDTRKGKRKLARPIALRRPMHVVLRSEQARGPWSMLRRQYAQKINALIHTRAKTFGVEVHQCANSGNHIHLLIQAKTRKGFQGYLKTLTGLIARLITGAKRGEAKGRFWTQLAYSRVVSWGRDYKGTMRYVFQNTLEAFDLSTRQEYPRPKDQMLKDLILAWKTTFGL